ncbi:helix-turn-helix domain-containing protein [Streptomyces sp. NPDC002346]
MTTATAVTDEQIHAAQTGDQDAMWQIVSAYDPMLKSVVRSVAPAANQDEAEDLHQEARAVLIQHVRDYSTTASGAQLHSYAYLAVRRAVANEWVRSTTSLTVDPSTALTVKRALWTAEGDVEEAWTIVSANDDPKRRISREGFVSVCEALADVVSLSTPVNGKSTAAGVDTIHKTLADTIPDTSSTITDSTERRELARYLLSEIPQRQALALRAFYGIGMTRTGMPDVQAGADKSADMETAAHMGITTAALRKLRSNGLASCRNVAHSHGLAA